MKTKETDKSLNLEDNDFWAEIERQFMMCYKVSDKFGHIEKCQFSISKTERNLVSQVRACYPEDWFKSQAEFNRSVFKVGRLMLTALAKRKGWADKNVDRAEKIFKAISYWEMNGRLDEAENFANKILASAFTENPVNMGKVKKMEEVKKDIGKIKKGLVSAWEEDD